MKLIFQMKKIELEANWLFSVECQAATRIEVSKNVNVQMNPHKKNQHLKQRRSCDYEW